ncbi:MAG: hypothetical protein ABI663_07300 [Chryseolinea sp.]
MRVRLTAIMLAVFFLCGNAQAFTPLNAFGKSSEIKIASSSLKNASFENSADEDEFTHHPASILFNFSTTFSLKVLQRHVFVTSSASSFIHKPSQPFILYRVLRN